MKKRFRLKFFTKGLTKEPQNIHIYIFSGGGAQPVIIWQSDIVSRQAGAQWKDGSVGASPALNRYFGYTRAVGGANLGGGRATSRPGAWGVPREPRAR